MWFFRDMLICYMLSNHEFFCKYVSFSLLTKCLCGRMETASGPNGMASLAAFGQGGVVLRPCFTVYLLHTFCRYKILFVTPAVLSFMCSLWKTRPTFWDPLQTFSELMIWTAFKLWLFPERSHSSTNRNSHFLGLQNVTSVSTQGRP